MTSTAYPYLSNSQAIPFDSLNESDSHSEFDSDACRDTSPPRNHRRFGWRKPPKTRRRPPVIERTAFELIRGLEHRRGSIYQRLCRLAPIAGYSRRKELDQGRRRQWRSDGVESALGMLMALIYCSDVRSGFVGRPKAGGGRWQRFGLVDLAHFAYASTDAATLKRASRTLFVLEGLGLLAPTAQIRTTTEAGEIRSENAVRRLNWARLCDLCGTTWLLKKDRQALDQKHGPAAPNLGLPQASKAGQGRRDTGALAAIADLVKQLSFKPSG